MAKTYTFSSRTPYKDFLLHQIESIRNSKDAPYRKLTNLLYSSSDYEINRFRVIMDKLNKRLKTAYGEYVAYLPLLINYLLEIATVYAELGETKTMQQWYEIIISLLSDVEEKVDEKQRLKQENFYLKNKVRELEEQLSDAKNRNSLKQEEIVRLREHLFFMRNEQLPHGVIFDRLPDNEAQKKKEKALEDKIKNLQEKLGNESVPLSVLAEGLMDYAEEAGICETHDLFNHLNNLLINVPAWTKNVPELKKFFRKARKEMEGRNVTMTGEHATYNENNKK